MVEEMEALMITPEAHIHSTDDEVSWSLLLRMLLNNQVCTLTL